MRVARILFILCGMFAALPARADMSGTYVSQCPPLAEPALSDFRAGRAREL